MVSGVGDVFLLSDCVQNKYFNMFKTWILPETEHWEKRKVKQTVQIAIRLSIVSKKQVL